MVCFVVFRSLFIVNQQWTLSYGCSIHWCHHCMDLCMELVCCSIHWIFTQIYTDLICCSIHQRHPSYVAVGWLFHSLFGYFLLSFSSTIWMSSFGSIIIFSALCCHVLPIDLIVNGSRSPFIPHPTGMVSSHPTGMVWSYWIWSAVNWITDLVGCQFTQISAVPSILHWISSHIAVAVGLAFCDSMDLIEAVGLAFHDSKSV